tara:strand:+ start:2051 stop:3469 length:1419 start_codon:yes stop_codon:yes gene_type:complete
MNADTREKERAFFEAERKRVPHLFERSPMVDSKEFLEHIGVTGQKEDLPTGYLKLMPQDFIVEEISKDGLLHSVDFEKEAQQKDLGTGPTLYADVVKFGISTFQVQEQVAELFHIPTKDIGYAGIKDAAALTSQFMSMRGVSPDTDLEKVKAENWFLKNFFRGKGVVANGDLKGNRFVITIRLQDSLSETQISEIQEKLEKIQEEGFWNFFSFQRFGTPRLLSHKLGLLIIKGNFEEAVKLFLSHQSKRELPYFKNIRSEIERQWGDWKTIQGLIDQFPYHFSIELKFINHLVEHPTDFLGALHTVPEQVRLWIYAYDSYLFNRKLSQLIQTGEVPFELPLLTSFNPKDWEPYQELLKEDGLDVPSRHYKKFPFVRVASRTWPVLQQVEIHNKALQDKLAVFAFSLPKGTYATTFLMNFFTLASGLPMVSGISHEELDAKALLQLGSLQSTLEQFQDVLRARKQDIERNAEV